MILYFCVRLVKGRRILLLSGARTSSRELPKGVPSHPLSSSAGAPTAAHFYSFLQFLTRVWLYELLNYQVAQNFNARRIKNCVSPSLG